MFKSACFDALEEQNQLKRELKKRKNNDKDNKIEGFSKYEKRKKIERERGCNAKRNERKKNKEEEYEDEE